MENNQIRTCPSEGSPQNDGNDRFVFPTWKEKLCVYPTIGSPGINNIMHGSKRLNPPGDADNVETSVGSGSN